MALHIENLPPIVKASTTQITLASTYLGQTSVARIGGQFYRLSALTLNTGTSGIGGLDTGSIANNTLYYVYLVVNGSNVPGLVMSTSSSAPTGFTRYKYIGKTKTFFGSTSLVDVNPLFVGNSFSEKGVEVGPVIAFTPESNLSTNVILTGFYYRDGEYIIGEMSCEFTGTNTQNLVANLGIPASIGTVNLSKKTISQDGNSGIDNNGYFSDDTGSSYQILGQWDANVLYLYLGLASGTYITYSSLNPSSNVPVVIADDDFITIKFCAPITEYSGLFT